MKVDRKAKFCIFFVIAILALGLSNFAAAFTGDFVSTSLPGINDTDKMIALDDDNFSPATINAVYEEKKVVEEVNETDNSTDSNSTIKTTIKTVIQIQTTMKMVEETIQIPNQVQVRLTMEMNNFLEIFFY